MDRALIELARRIERRPCNAPGTDKTWVLAAMWQHLRLQREIRAVRRVDSR